MSGQLDLWSGGGSEVNPVKIGSATVLNGDPKRKREKPHTIIRFPGGSVEIARTEDNDYWVHVAVHTVVEEPAGRIIGARMDHDGRYNDEGNAALREAITAGDVRHIAFLVEPSSKPKRSQ